MEWKTDSRELKIANISKTLIGCALVLGLAAATKPSNSISGRVLDHQGKPVVGAQVLLSIGNVGGATPTTTSGRDGRFTFKSIPNVRLELYARKEDDYLMDPRAMILGFSTGGRAPVLRIKEEQHLRNQIIQFGPPGGRFVIRFANIKRKILEQFKYKIARKGRKPAIDRYFYSFDVIIPVGDYELRLFTREGEYITTVDLKIRRRQTTEKTIKLPAKFADP